MENLRGQRIRDHRPSADGGRGMNEGRITNVWCWKPTPGLTWRVYEGTNRIVIDATSKQEAIDHFNQIWNFRAPVHWIYDQAPPQPKRAGAATPDAPAVENLTEKER